MAVGKWIADPAQLLTSMRSDSRYLDDYLVEAMAEVLAVEADPAGALQTAVWQQPDSNWAVLKQHSAKRRRHLRGRTL